MLSLHNEMSRLFFVLDIPFSSDNAISIQFMSPGVGDGASTVAREFAMVAAQQIEGKVLLLDLNISGFPQYDDIRNDRSGRFGSLKKVQRPNVDLNTIWLCEQDDHVVRDQGLDVDLYEVGDDSLFVTVNSFFNTQYCSDIKLRNDGVFWEAIQKEFQLVIVDSQPLTENFDGLVAARHVDSTIVVITAEKTRRPVAKNLCDRIVESGGHVAGVILNRRQMHIPHIFYKYL